jgi:hypothetical protein
MIVDGEPGDPTRECFPRTLRFKVRPDGHLMDEREEPIAADARPQGDGKERAKLKVVASLLGVGLDEVRNRYEIAWRRVATIRTLVALCCVALAILAGYLLWHEREWNRREEQMAGEQRQRDVQQHRQLATANLHIADTKAIVEKLLALSQGHIGFGREVALNGAVLAAKDGAASGDVRLATALDLLRAGKPTEAEPLFQALRPSVGRWRQCSGPLPHYVGLISNFSGPHLITAPTGFFRPDKIAHGKSRLADRCPTDGH